MKQFLAFVTKEFLHVFRDRKTLITLFGLPIAMIILFGFAVTNEIKNSKIAVLDYAKDEASQQIIEKFRASSHFNLEQTLSNHNEIEETFKNGKIKMVIIFPNSFHKDLIHENKAQIQLILDSTDPNTATTLTHYANQIILSYQQDFVKKSQLIQKIPYLINTEIRMIYNPELRAAVNFVPGIVSLVLLLVCVLMTSASIVKEKEIGTMEVLLVSPFNPLLVIISKAIPYLALSIINLTVILLLSVFALKIPINGSILLLYAVSTLFIITALSLGLLISNLTNSQQTAMLISLAGMLIPSILLTGFMFPLENMPSPLQVIANIVPAKWFYIIVKSIMIKGLGFFAIWKETLVLLGMTLVLLLVNFKKFKVRLS